MADLATIDISTLFQRDARDRFATEGRIREAVAGTGGFLIANYPGAEQVDARAAMMLAFFDLPEAAKRALGTKVTTPENERIYRGYLAYLKPGNWAHNEFFDIGPEDPVPGPPISGMEILAESNIWPVIEPAPGWRHAMLAFYDHMKAVSTVVMMAVGRAAGFTDEEMTARFEGGNSTLRLLNYPTPPEGLSVVEELPDKHASGNDTIRLAAGRHTDAAGISLLWQGQPGLQAQAPDGVWYDVPCRDNCISVHLGDVLDAMTGGKFPATPHRVIDNGTARQSIGFFLEPALGARIAPPDAESRSVEDAASARGTYGWHLLRRLHSYEGYEGLVPRPD